VSTFPLTRRVGFCLRANQTDRQCKYEWNMVKRHSCVRDTTKRVELLLQSEKGIHFPLTNFFLFRIAEWEALARGGGGEFLHKQRTHSSVLLHTCIHPDRSCLQVLENRVLINCDWNGRGSILLYGHSQVFMRQHWRRNRKGSIVFVTLFFSPPPPPPPLPSKLRVIFSAKEKRFNCPCSFESSSERGVSATAAAAAAAAAGLLFRTDGRMDGRTLFSQTDRQKTDCLLMLPAWLMPMELATVSSLTVGLFPNAPPAALQLHYFTFCSSVNASSSDYFYATACSLAMPLHDNDYVQSSLLPWSSRLCICLYLCIFWVWCSLSHSYNFSSHEFWRSSIFVFYYH
jgi:hypothetical protein